MSSWKATFIVCFLFIVVLVLGGWTIRWDALRDCNKKWESSIREANLKLELEAAANAEKYGRLEVELIEALADRKELLEVQEKLILAQRKQVPLSDACRACVIPADRLRLRDGREKGDRIQGLKATESGGGVDAQARVSSMFGQNKEFLLCRGA